MSTEYYDETFEEQQAREKLEHFFGQYSAEVRKTLLSKNVKRPENLYDVLYTETRKTMLAKNESTFTANLDENSTNIRNTMISKHVEKQIDLDISGENYRQSQISKNSLLKSSVGLEELSDSVRENLLSKNIPHETNLDIQSKDARNSNISHNVEKKINLDDKSVSVRENLLSSNVPANLDLESKAISTREEMLGSNIKSNINIDNESLKLRNASLSKNIEGKIDIDKDSSQFREAQEFKNIEKNINLDLSAVSTRDNLLSSNVSKKIDLDANSTAIRDSLLLSNVQSKIDLDANSTISRDSLLSSNVPISANLDANSTATRDSLLSSNVAPNINLDSKSTVTRESLLSSNVPSKVNLDANSTITRDGLLSANVTANVNLDSNSTTTRENLLSSNVPANIDLDASSTVPRDSLLASNVPANTNLDSNSTTARENLLSSNVPANIDLDANSTVPRNTLLANNVPVNIDLDANSTAPRNTLLASNVPNNIDLDANSVIPRDSLLASNVPNNIDLDANSIILRDTLLSSNVPSNTDLDVLSAVPRGALLAANVPVVIDLDGDALISRNALLASNVVNNIDLDQNSLSIRNDLLSANVPQYLSLESDSVGTRNSLLSKNVDRPNTIITIANATRHNLLTKNGNSNGLGTSLMMGGTSTFVGVSNLEIMSAPIRELMKFKGTILDATKNLKPIYGLETKPDSGIPLAKITNAAQLYNLQKNVFRNRYDDLLDGYSILNGHNAGGFKELLSLSNSTLKNEKVLSTNSTPAGVVSAKGGTYVGLQSPGEYSDGISPVTQLLKPTNGEIGTAISMMSNTVPGDAIAVDFNKHERGVTHIINTIKNAPGTEGIDLSKNYNQRTKKFLISADPNAKKAYARYTIANPYKPSKDAGTLELRIKNYAIQNGDSTLNHTMSFPPYVKSFSNSDSANWNKVDFLGRPEPIYTYSNSNREGSISFFVLTDYSQTVDVGVNWEDSTTYSETFSKHFESENGINTANDNIEVEIKNKKKQISEYNAQLLAIASDDVGNTSTLKSQISELNSEISNLEAKQKDNSSNVGNRKYGDEGGKIYRELIKGGEETNSSGDISLKTKETKERLKEMKKDLMFQPAFFSGDKVDFLTRMEFLSKLTRPSRNTSGKGFSFTYPPVSHLKLGDWFNYDVIINNIWFSYDDSPWSIDGSGGRVQPMWCVATLSFNIVGNWGESTSGSNAPLADDIGGFYQARIK